jgi:phosphoribosylcarboxyaminoimidazole (NCAIR) mutase
MDKDTKELLKEAEKQGFTVIIKKKGHPVIYLDGVRITTFSGSTSDWRAFRNSLAHLKRAGFQWPARKR